MLPSSTSYSSSFPFRSNDDPVIFTLYSTTFNDMNSEEDFNIDHYYNHQTNDLIKWVKNNGDFSEMIENMFEWNVMGTLSDGVRVFYIDDNEKENVKKEITEEEIRKENEYLMNEVENEEFIVEEEEIIEMSGVSLYEGCYDIEMKLVEESFVNHGISGAHPLSENKQNRREKVSRDDQEERIKESRKFNVQKGKDRKKVKKQLENRIQELGQEIHELKGKLSVQNAH